MAKVKSKAKSKGKISPFLVVAGVAGLTAGVGYLFLRPGPSETPGGDARGNPPSSNDADLDLSGIQGLRGAGIWA